MRPCAGTAFRCAGAGLVVMVLAIGLPAAARAGTWSVEVEPVYLDVLGHDQHVLTDRTIDADASPAQARHEAVTLTTDPALGYRAEVLYARERWQYGLDFLIFRTDQGVDPRSGAAGGAVDQRVFEVGGRRFTSGGPGEVLYFQTLEDTTVELWVLDLYAARPVAESEGASLLVVFGLRNADFDNDYRAVAGKGAVGGVRVDASSNYSRMLGPLVGLAARFERGRHSLRADLRQSVVVGEVELTRSLTDFVGPPGPFAGPPEGVPSGVAFERLQTTQDIAVPMTDLRLGWAWGFAEHFSAGVSVEGAAWWDVSVPPAVVPAPPGVEDLHETTLLTYGLGVSLRYSF